MTQPGPIYPIARHQTIKPRAPQIAGSIQIMGKKNKTTKTDKPDYIYQCPKCRQIKHEGEPSNLPCPQCGKRMELRSWTR